MKTLKNIIPILAILISPLIYSNYFVTINNDNYKVEISDIEDPVIPSPSVDIIEEYPFSSLYLHPFTFVSDGTRHYATGSSYGTYVSPGNYSKIKFKVPTEAGIISNQRQDLIISLNDQEIETCEVPIGNYELFYCYFEVNEVLTGDVFKIEGKVGTGAYTIFGSIYEDDETFEIEHFE